MTPLTLAKLSAAAYEIDPHTGSDNCKALGLDFLGLIGIADCQALIARDDASTIVAIRGTEVFEHTNLEEIWDDVNVVRAGFWEPLSDLWFQLRHYIDPMRKVVGTGHSLGAQRALELAGIVPPWIAYEVTAFAPPKGANAAFWKIAYAGLDGRERPPPVIYGRASDFALNWPPLDRDCCHPGPINWINDGKIVPVPDWPIASESIADHAIGLYVSDLAAIEAAQAAPQPQPQPQAIAA